MPLKGHKCPLKTSAAAKALEAYEILNEVGLQMNDDASASAAQNIVTVQPMSKTGKRKRNIVLDDDSSDDDGKARTSNKALKSSNEEDEIIHTICMWKDGAKRTEELKEQNAKLEAKMAQLTKDNSLLQATNGRLEEMNVANQNKLKQAHARGLIMQKDIQGLVQQIDDLKASAVASSNSSSSAANTQSIIDAHECLVDAALKHVKWMSNSLHAPPTASSTPIKEIEFTIDMSTDNNVVDLQPITTPSIVALLLTLNTNSASLPETWKPTPAASVKYAHNGHSYVTTVSASGHRGLIEQVNQQTSKKRIIHHKVVTRSPNPAPTTDRNKFLFESEGMFDVPTITHTVHMCDSFQRSSTKIAELAEELSKVTGVERKYDKSDKTESKAWFKPAMFHAWCHASEKYHLKQCRLAVHGTSKDANKTPMLESAFMFNHLLAKPGIQGLGLYVSLTDHLTQWHNLPGHFVIGLLLCDKTKVLNDDVAKYYNLCSHVHWDSNHPSGTKDTVVDSRQAMDTLRNHRNAIRLRHDELFLPLGFAMP